MASKKRKAAVQVDIDDFLLERKRKKTNIQYYERIL